MIKDGGEDVVMVAYLPQTDTTTGADLTAAYTGVDPMKLEAYVDKAVSGDLLKEEPQPGKVTKEEELKDFDATLWTLSNGIKVYLRPSTEQPDRITGILTTPQGRLNTQKQ